jgi:hypothetical protein
MPIIQSKRSSRPSKLQALVHDEYQDRVALIKLRYTHAYYVKLIWYSTYIGYQLAITVAIKGHMNNIKPKKTKLLTLTAAPELHR